MSELQERYYNVYDEYCERSVYSTALYARPISNQSQKNKNRQGRREKDEKKSERQSKKK